MKHKDAYIYLVVEAKDDGVDLFEGTADEVAGFVGVHPTQVRRASLRGSLVRSKYRIEPKYEIVEPRPNVRKVKTYLVYRDSLSEWFMGTVHEIASRTGATPQAVRQAIRGQHQLKGDYTIYDDTNVR